MLTIEPRHIDHYFRDFIARVAPDCSAALLQVMVELSHALSQQHSCLDLAGRQDAEQLVSELSALGLTGEKNSPIALQGKKLYLRRYHHYEKTIVELLIACNRPQPINDSEDIGRALKGRYTRGGSIDWQQIAALQALTRKLTIITGGPGTGKTTTVATIIDLLKELAPAPLQIRLAAPTGKAAMRLSQSLTSDDDGLRVQTLHRLLGVRRDGRSFRFNTDNPIACDVLIVDEASMIDLPMMYRVLTALPDHCRLILVGDPDQLPSVETGNVLADLCAPAVGYSNVFSALAGEMLDVTLPVQDTPHPLDDVVCRLTVSHRFSPEEGIGRLAQHVMAHNTEMPISDDDGVRVFDPRLLMSDDKSNLLLENFRDYLALLQAGETDHSLLTEVFDRARLLSPMREGDLGVEDLNNTIEAALESLGLKTPLSDFYHGRPILVLRNDYNLQLYNGDVGICVGGEDIQHPMVAFPTEKGNADGETRLLLASRLPPHETCFAMTVHKAQGSEFETVTLILPAHLTDTTEQLLSRELVYTAVTRARTSVKLYSTEPVWRRCMENSEPRVSGLNDFLRPPPQPTSKRSDTHQQLSLFP